MHLLFSRDYSACSTYYYQSEENVKNNIKTMIDYKNVMFTKNQFEDCRKMVFLRHLLVLDSYRIY